MERFEITFFCKKEAYNESAVELIDRCARKYPFFGEVFFTEVFAEDNRDFTEIRFSIPDLVLTSKTYEKAFAVFSNFVSDIFTATPEIEVATGIYQLTYYLIERENKKRLNEFDSEFLSKFPLVFIRPENHMTQGMKIFQDDHVIGIYHKNAQILYS